MRVSFLCISIAAILLQLLVQQTDAEPVGICPPENGDFVDFLTHATDCSKFYKCDWGSPVEFDCPDGLHFNSELNVCDWPDVAGCKSSTSTAAPPNPTNGPEITTDGTTGSTNGCSNDPCPAINGEYPVYFPHASCSKFCQCDWGVAYEMDCPAGLHFNPELNVCDWPHDAGCAGSGTVVPPTDPDTTTARQPTEETEETTTPEATTTPQGTSTGSCSNEKCPAINGEYPVYFSHADCGKFCQCDWGVAYEMDCPAGLHFNQELNVCDWPQDAGCDESATVAPIVPETTTAGEQTEETEEAITPEATTTTQRPSNGSCSNEKCPAINGEYPVYFSHADCGKFCQCDWGVAYEMDCPAGLHFNQNLNVCDWPQDAGCDESATVAPIDPETTTAGEQTEETEEAITPEATTTTQRPSNGSCSNEKCPAINGEYPVYFSHADCGKFCQCDWGVAYEMDCPAGLHFNQNLNVCDWPQDAGCDESATVAPIDPETTTAGEQTEETEEAITPEATTTTQRPSNGSCSNEKCPAINGEYPVYFSHADCGKFCQCDWGVAYEMDCPAGLHFNQNLNVCDWPQDAGCDESATVAPIDPETTTAGEQTEETEEAITPEATTTTQRPSNGSCSNEKCPAINGEYPVYFSHADCGKFCQCDWGVAYEMDCPAGLHFNQDLNVCDWPQDAGCDESATVAPIDPETTTAGEQTEETEEAITPEATTTTQRPSNGSCSNEKCPAINGEYPVYFSHADCGKFCQCDWGVAYEMDCPAGLHFNQDLNVCDWPQDAGCDESATVAPIDPETTTAGEQTEETEEAITPEATTTTQRPSNGSCSNEKCPAINGEYPVYFSHADCGKFCQCDWGVAYEMDCPAGLHFNQNLNVCDWPQDAGCDESATVAPIDPETTTAGEPTEETEETITPEATTTTQGPTTGSCSNEKCPAINGEYPVYFSHADCCKFCQCDWGVAYEMDCPAGLHFNQNLNVCDWPQDAGCDESATVAPIDPETTTAGEPTEETEETITPEATTTTQGPTTGSCSNEKCPAINGEYPVYFSHADCGKFCQCDWGVAYEMDCPAGLHFNQHLNVCDWPQDAGCDESATVAPIDPETTTAGEPTEETEETITPEATTTTQGPTTGSCSNEKCPAINGEYPVYFSHADCGKFCQCDWGVAYEMDCPAGLHFNQHLNVCDWPQDAGCDESATVAPIDPETTTAGEPTEETEETITPEATTTTQGPTTGSCSNEKCPAINGEYPVYFSHADCGKFCQCDWGVAYEMDCPAGLHFNQHLNVCDWPQDAGCDESATVAPIDPETTTAGEQTEETEEAITPEATTTTQRPSNGSCSNEKCPAINGEYPVYFSHADCGKFCQCDWGVAYEMDCPAGLHFNQELNVCDWPQDAGCDESATVVPPTVPETTTAGQLTEVTEVTTTSEATTTTQGPSTGSCSNEKCPAINGEYPVYFSHADCGKFCQCDWGVAYEMDCPAGLHFNQELNVCDWPQDAGCDESATVVPPTVPETTTAGQLTEVTEVTTTSEATTTTQGPSTGSCSNEKCPAINGEYPVYFSHADCGKFCQCDWGVAYEMDCPAGLHFNQELNVCDWPQDAGCDGSITVAPPTESEATTAGDNGSTEEASTPEATTTAQAPSTGSCSSDKCPAINGEFPVYFPVADCGKFCVCDWGVAYEMICPDDLHFNPEKNVCDWPLDAGCTGQVQEAQ